MKVLKTIVATAVIVFTLTTVAMAGVQHFTQRDDTSDNTRQVKAAQVSYTVRLTERQLERLAAALAGQHVANAKHAARHDQQDRTSRHATRHATARHQETVHHTQSVASAGSGSGTHHEEPAHTETHHSSGTASGGTSGGHHDGGHEGEGCD